MRRVKKLKTYSLVLVLTLSLICVTVSIQKSPIAKALEQNNISSELNNLVYSNAKEIDSSNSIDAATLADEIVNKINVRNAKSKYHYDNSDVTEVQNNVLSNEMNEDTYKAFENYAKEVQKFLSTPVSNQDQNDVNEKSIAEINDGLIPTLRSLQSKDKLSYTNDEITNVDKYFTTSFANRLRSINNSYDTFSVSDNEIMQSFNKSGLFDEEGELAIRYVAWANVGIYTSHPYVQYTTPTGEKGHKPLKGDNKTADLCDNSYNIPDGSKVSFIDQDVDDWWGESTGHSSDAFTLSCVIKDQNGVVLKNASKATIGIVTSGTAGLNMHKASVDGIALLTTNDTGGMMLQTHTALHILKKN